jgi:hypothetical protein
MPTTLIASGACTLVTAAGTGIATTDIVEASFASDPTGVTGYSPTGSGTLAIIPFPTSNNANFEVCNNTASGLTAGAINVNWKVTSFASSGTATLGTSAIASGACATVVTVSATGVSSTSAVMASFNADPTSTTGYQPTQNGMLSVVSYPTANAVNFKICNNTGASVTPGATTLNWRAQ